MAIIDSQKNGIVIVTNEQDSKLQTLLFSMTVNFQGIFCGKYSKHMSLLEITSACMAPDHLVYFLLQKC